jgi:hypothetical protein
MKFVIILFGILIISIAGFIQMHIYAQMKLKTTLLILAAGAVAFTVVGIIKL